MIFHMTYSFLNDSYLHMQTSRSVVKQSRIKGLMRIKKALNGPETLN